MDEREDSVFKIVRMKGKRLLEEICIMKLGVEYRADAEYKDEGTQTLRTFTNNYHREPIELARVSV